LQAPLHHFKFEHLHLASATVKKKVVLIVLCQSIVSVLYAQSNATPLTLSQTLRLTVEQSPYLKIENYNVPIAEGNVTTAKLRPNPVLNNQSLFSGNSNYFPDNSHFLGKSNRQVWYQLTKPFVPNAQRTNRIELANKNVQLTKYQLNEIKRNLLLDAANQWLNAWAVGVQIDLLKAAISNVDSLLIINRLRLKNQFATATEVTRTQLLYDQYTVRLKATQQNYQNELKQLGLLIGTDTDLSLADQDSTHWQNLNTSLPDLLNAALKNRPDLQATQQTNQMAETNILLQKALAKPTPELGLIYNPQNKIPYFGFFGTIALPVFSKNQGEIQKSKIVKEQTAQSITTAELRIRTEVQTAYGTYMSQKQNLSRWQEIIQQSSDVLNTVRYAYLHGGTTIVDFLEAQRSWFDTQNIYYEAFLSYRRSYVQLLYTTGEILDTEK
jgi:outer membrane protein, heavy metal efflux system